MPEINLLKNEIREPNALLNGLKGAGSLYLSIGVLAVAILAYGIFFILDRNALTQVSSLEKSAGDVNLEIAKLEKNKADAVTMQAQLSNTQVLLEKHIYWTQILGELEKYTFKPVFYVTLSVNPTTHELALTGTATSNSDIAKLVLGLDQSKIIKNVNLDSVALSVGEVSGYNFNLSATYDPKYLEKNAKK